MKPFKEMGKFEFNAFYESVCQEKENRMESMKNVNQARLKAFIAELSDDGMFIFGNQIRLFKKVKK